MTTENSRRAVLGAVLGAGAVVASPLPFALAAGAVALGAADREVLDLWHGRLEYFRMAQMAENEDEEDRLADLACGCLHKLDQRIGTSIVALGAILVISIQDGDEEPVSGLHRASLVAIRPQLVGAIAEAADRVLAEEEEDA